MTAKRSGRPAPRLAIGGAVIALALGGCGGGGPAKPVSPGGSSSASTTTRAPGTTRSSAPPTSTARATTRAGTPTPAGPVQRTIVTSIAVPKTITGALPAALARRVRRACETGGGYLTGSLSAGGKGPTAVQQLAQQLLPRASSLQQAILPLIARSGANSRVGIVLSPLMDAVSGLQASLQTALQKGQSVSLTQLQQETQQVSQVAYQLGVPQCALVGG